MYANNIILPISDFCIVVGCWIFWRIPWLWMYFLYDLAQFRRKQPVHLLQEQLWHSLSSLPPKKHANKKSTFKHLQITSEKVPKHQKISGPCGERHWSEDSTKSPIPSLTSSHAQNLPSRRRHKISDKNPVSWWVNFQQAGGVHLQMQNQQNSCFKSWEHMFQNNVNIDYVAVHVCPSRSPYQHLFGTNIYLTISYHLFYSISSFRRLRDVGIAKKALNLSCILPATQKRCKVLLGRLKCTTPPLFIGSANWKFWTNWKGLFWNIWNGMMAPMAPNITT